MQGLEQKAYFKITLSALCAAILSACGGGGGSGGEQDPDPVVVDLAIAFVQRPLPADEDGNPISDNMLDPAAFNPGAELVLKDRASASAPQTIISAGAFAEGELYDVKDVEASSDGDKLIFAMRAPEIEDADEDEQPTWNIWEYDIDNRILRPIITDPIRAEGGEDVAPHYLPDGRIVFSSTRQVRSKAILLDENKTQFSALNEDNNAGEAFLLHVMDDDGTNIEQITFNQSNDLHPTVLDDGRVMFTRWDNVANRDSFSLYTIDPDGHNLNFYYGLHSQDTGTNDARIGFFQARQMPDGRILVSLRPEDSASLGGDLVTIDGDNFSEIDQPIAANSGLTGPGQASIAIDTVATDGSVSPHGHFSSAAPLFDGTERLLVSWSLCLLTDPATDQDLPCTDDNLANPDLVEARPRYGLWIYTLEDGTQRPVINAEDGMMYTEVVALEPKARNTALPRKRPGIELDQALFSEGAGVVHIRSVYDFDGTDSTGIGSAALADPLQFTAAERPARFLRILKAVSVPDEDVYDFDGNAFQGTGVRASREIIGYVPVEPDGSAKFKVPADVPFSLSVLNAEGRRIGPRHLNWLQVAAGEERTCNGCHTRNSEVPHGRYGAEPASINTGAPATGVPFPNTEPALFADLGETMAEVYSRINGPRTPSVDLVFDDEWTDPAARAKDPSIRFAYADLSSTAPASLPCQSDWNTLCRTVLSYQDHVQPMWEVNREVRDAMGNLIEDRTCISCHGITDAVGAPQVPAAQLELSGAASGQNALQVVSFRELLFNNDDNEQELDADGNLVDRLVQQVDADGNPVFVTDANGDLVLDADGNPIPVLVTIPVPAPLSRAGAVANQNRFFERFNPGGSHADYLTAAELKLISEWMDLGAPYLNDPFAAPLD